MISAGWKFGGLWSSPVPVGAFVFADPIVFDSCDLELPAIWTRDSANWTGSVSVEGGYKHNSTTYEPLDEKMGEDGTVFWHNLPGGTLIFVR